MPTRDYSPPSGPATLAVVHHRLCCTRLPGSQKRGEKRNGIFLRRTVLAPVYDSFSEGFDLPDLKQAKVLLDQLAANSELNS